MTIYISPLSFFAVAHSELHAVYARKSDLLKIISGANRGRGGHPAARTLESATEGLVTVWELIGLPPVT